MSFAACARKKTVWDYPIKPGTKAWAALSSHDEMVKTCQIPDEILKTMTTEELISACLNYPLKFDFFAYNNLQEGINKVANDFNGLQELLLRKDNLQCLLDSLQNNNLGTLDSLSVKNIPILQLGELIIKQSLTEGFISNKLILAKANNEQQKKIASIALNHLTKKEQMSKIYSRYSLESSAYLLCTALKKLNNGNTLEPELDSFLENGTLHNTKIIDLLKQKYLKILTQ